MKKFFFQFFLLSALFSMPLTLAQTTEEETAEEGLLNLAEALESSEFVPSSVMTGETFSVEIPEEVSEAYKISWIFDDGDAFINKKNHHYVIPGWHTFTIKITREDDVIFTRQIEILAYDKTGFLIAEKPLTQLVKSAGNRGIFLHKVIYGVQLDSFEREAFLLQKYSEYLEKINNADLLLFADESGFGIRIFSQFLQKISTSNTPSFAEKFLFQITESAQGRVARALQSAFETISPKGIVIIKIESGGLIFDNLKTINNNPYNILRESGVPTILVDENNVTSWFFPLSRLSNYFLANGISSNVAFLCLSVPFVAFLVAFWRQFVGFSTLGIFPPLILTMSFLVLGIKFGLFVFALVMLIGYLLRFFFEKTELTHVPRMSFLFAILGMIFFLVLGIAIQTGISIDLSLAIFPMLAMIMISERFVAEQNASGPKNAFILMIDTVVIAVIGYLFLESDWLKNLILSYPEMVVFPFLGLWFLAKFTGLRITEYFRFRSLINDNAQE